MPELRVMGPRRDFGFCPKCGTRFWRRRECDLKIGENAMTIDTECTVFPGSMQIRELYQGGGGASHFPARHVRATMKDLERECGVPLFRPGQNSLR